MNFRDRLIFAFGAAVLLVTAIAAISYRRILEEDSDAHWVEHTHVVLEAEDSVISDLLDYQSMQRGYAITGETSFLERATAARKQLERELSRLREVTIDNVSQQSALDRIEPLVRRELAMYDDAEQAIRHRDRELASRAIMAEIRRGFGEMKATEKRLLDERSAAAARHDAQVKRVIAGGYVMFFLALALAAAVIYVESGKRRRAEERILRDSAELKAANRELESFSYSVSHDLRAPLRAIDGFSQVLAEDYGAKLDAEARACLQRIRGATQRMGMLIDDLLKLSRVTRTEIRREQIDLSAMANEIARDLRAGDPERRAHFEIASGLLAQGDSHLLRIVLQNLLSNAWKFTSKRAEARIEMGLLRDNGQSTYFVRDNGAGFDPAYADRLFGAFQRLHGVEEFPGTGIGLATVQRVILRHGGKVWAEGAVDRGATIYFTL
jgi:signal transduction histidine kinase